MTDDEFEPLDLEDETRLKPVHVLLFALTFVATTMAGVEAAGAGLLLGDEMDLSPSVWRDGLLFSVPVMLILFAHEMGHYLQAKRHGVPATPPYFLPGIPIPGVGWLPFLGTFGAFIKMTVGRVRARPLLEISAWGPLAGFVLAVPALAVGIAISPVEPVPDGAQPFGNTVVILLSEWLFHPDIPEGHDVMLHPIGMAGWFGCFLTSLNLMPVGQLDGGHIAFVWAGRVWNRVAPFVFGAMLVLGVVEFLGWFIFAGLVWKLGVRHPDIVVDGPVRGRDSWLAWASVIMFVVTFTPAPIQGGSLIEIVTAFVQASP
jgi:membrane-associated protease RseP (regulator of RpoE activity)